MSLSWTVHFVTFLITIATASVISLPGAEDPSLRNPQTSNGSHATSLSFLPITSLNVTADNAFIIKCDGDQYGRNLNIADCKDAKDYIPPGLDQYAWVKRYTAMSKPHFALPYRYMGDRGRCYIELGLAPGYTLSYASLYQVQNAAKTIISKCGAGGTLQGGIASNLGADGGLTMVLGDYQAAVECRGTFGPRETCATIIDDMEVSKISETFGPKSEPALQVTLPVTIESRDGKSSVRLFGTLDTTSWYDIWEAVVLVYSVCARHGKGGSVKGLGDHSKLFLTMTAKSSSLSNYTRAEEMSFE